MSDDMAPQGAFTIRWDADFGNGLGAYRVNIAGYDGGEVVPADVYRQAMDDLGAIGHAFLAYENAPLADLPNYRAELIAKVREVVQRRVALAGNAHQPHAEGSNA